MTPVRPPGRRSRRGITLVEVVVAMAVLGVMSAIVFESVRNSVDFNQILSDRGETVRAARVTLSKLRRDIQMAYLTPNKNFPDRYQTVFVGIDDDPDMLVFASLNHQRLYLNSRESDQTEITVWAEENDDDDGLTLYHREASHIDEEPDEQGTIWPLARNVRSFDIRYLDQVTEDWVNEWDTRTAQTPYRLPRALEIALVLIAPDPEDPTGEETIDVPFLSRVIVQYAPRMPGPDGVLGGVGAGGIAGAGAPGEGNGGFAGGGARGLQGGPLTGGSLGALAAQNAGRNNAAGRGRPARSGASAQRPQVQGASGGVPR